MISRDKTFVVVPCDDVSLYGARVRVFSDQVFGFHDRVIRTLMSSGSQTLIFS